MRDTADYSGLTLEIMDLVGDKWTLLVVYTLGEGDLTAFLHQS